MVKKHDQDCRVNLAINTKLNKNTTAEPSQKEDDTIPPLVEESRSIDPPEYPIADHALKMSATHNVVSSPVPSPSGYPYLIMLPVEIKRMIISYLSDERVFKLHHAPKYHVLEPSLQFLRDVHPSFRCLIPHRRIKTKGDMDRADMLLTAEDRWPSSFVKDQYPCYGCLRVLDVSEFDFEGMPNWRIYGGEHALGRRRKRCEQRDPGHRERIPAKTETDFDRFLKLLKVLGFRID